MGVKKVFKIVCWTIAIMFILLGMWRFIDTMNYTDKASRECRENHFGKMEGGYCLYTTNGTSQGYNIWDERRSYKEETKNNG